MFFSRISEDEDAENDDGHNSSIYKMKYERAAKELEFTKRRLQTQHEHDLDQLIGLKKQLEKKLADAYEEVLSFSRLLLIVFWSYFMKIFI